MRLHLVEIHELPAAARLESVVDAPGALPPPDGRRRYLRDGRGLRHGDPAAGITVEPELSHPCSPRTTTGIVRSMRRQSRQSDQLVA